LLDEVLKHLPPETASEDSDLVRVAFVGRPNVGKSSLVNALLGKERVIVSDQPGTTRDAIDSPLAANGRHYLLVDTAGIRRKSKVEEAVEYYSVLRAMRAVERADVAVLVLDATESLAEQDLRVAGIIKEAGKACLIAVNKWDLVEKDEHTATEFSEELRRGLDFLDYAPIIMVSAKTKQRLPKLLEAVDRVMESYCMRIPTNRLNHLIGEAVALHPPPSTARGCAFKVYFTRQTRVKPPTFLFTVSDPEGMHFSYRRYLENRLREEFDFTGTPVRFEFMSSSKKGQ
jgi:GTP-binding protein